MEVYMQILSSIFTIILLLGYLILWQIKRKEILKSNSIDVNVLNMSSSPVQRFFGVLEKIMTITITLLIVSHFFLNDWVIAHYIFLLDSTLMKCIGFILGLLGLGISKIAQRAIGSSWRVGIDVHAKPGLITHGIYKYIRNPTYLGLFILGIGVWIINPSILYFIWVVVFILLLEIQVRCEEEYLESKYGNEYLEYCRKTKRYIPMIY